MQVCKTFTGENMYLTGLEARDIILKRIGIYFDILWSKEIFQECPE
jgi:hypothetical protein